MTNNTDFTEQNNNLNSNDILTDVEISENDERLDSEQLNENDDFNPDSDLNNTVRLGASTQTDLLDVVTNLDTDFDLTNKNTEELANQEDKLSLADQHAQNMIDKYLAPYEFDKKFMYKDGKPVGELKNHLGKTKQIHLGFEPEPETVVASLMKLNPNLHIDAYPNTPQNLENFKAAMRMVRDDHAFDLSKITFNNKDKELDDFKKALEEIMNEPKVKLGQSLESEAERNEQDLEAENTAPEHQKNVQFGSVEHQTVEVEETELLNDENSLTDVNNDDIDRLFTVDDLELDDDIEHRVEEDIELEHFDLDDELVPKSKQESDLDLDDITFDDEDFTVEQKAELEEKQEIVQEQEQTQEQSISQKLDDERSSLLDDLRSETDVQFTKNTNTRRDRKNTSRRGNNRMR